MVKLKLVLKTKLMVSLIWLNANAVQTMKKICLKLHSSRGDVAFAAVVIIIVLALSLALALSAFSFFPKIQNIKSMAIEVVRVAETTGEIGTAVNSTLSRLQTATKLTPSVEWNVSYISGTNKIQSGSEFTLVLRSTAKLEVGSLFSVDIPIKGTASGRGEVVWK